MHDPTNEQISQWAEKLSRSDEKAFDALFRALYPRLTALACRHTAPGYGCNRNSPAPAFN